MIIKHNNQEYIVQWSHQQTNEYNDYLWTKQHFQNINKYQNICSKYVLVKPKSSHVTYCKIKTVEGKVISVGESLCSSTDQFEKHIGRCLSLERASKGIDVPIEVIKQQYQKETNKNFYEI